MVGFDDPLFVADPFPPRVVRQISQKTDWEEFVYVQAEQFQSVVMLV